MWNRIKQMFNRPEMINYPSITVRKYGLDKLNKEFDLSNVYE